MGNLQCGSKLAKSCKGDTDPRYSTTVSDDLESQSATWSSITGFWGPFSYDYISDVTQGGFARQPELFNTTSRRGWPYTRDKFTGYNRRITSGSRYTSQAILFYPPASADFCADDVPEGMVNVVGIDPANPSNTTAICGLNGNVVYMEAFSTSTYERDGSAQTGWSSMGPVYGGSSGPPPPGDGYMQPVSLDSTFIYLSFDIPGFPFAYSETETFLSEDADYVFGTGSSAAGLPVSSGGRGVVRNTFLYSGPRVDDEAAFQEEIRKAYADNNIPESEIPDWVSNGEPMPPCLSEGYGGCPSEEFFCGTDGKDPGCTSSPYKETNPSMKTGAVAGFTILGLAVFATVAYVFHMRSIKKQKKRLRKVFARQVAKRVDLRGSVSQLNPNDLASEFKRIDKGIKEGGSADGYISKEELWDFVQSGKAGDISEKDFDALFEAMDIQNRGKVNFVEFAGFMSECADEVREIVKETPKNTGQMSPEERLQAASLRLSTIKMTIPADFEDDETV